MSTSETINTSGIAAFTIKVNGTVVPDELSVVSLHIEKKVNRIPSAKIVILDGDANTGKFEASSSSTLVLGVIISIEAVYDGRNEVIF